MFLPILGLIGVVLLGTTRAGQPDPEEIVSMARTSQAMDTAALPPPPQAAPLPPPAPRLRSHVEAEERAAALADTAGRAVIDTTGARISELEAQLEALDTD